MEVAPMNKTAILRFIIDEVALKCRNVSTNMRKRIHWMLKHMEITVKKYDERVVMLNGWVRVGKEGLKVSITKNIKKGISNYSLNTQEQVDRIIELNNKLRCYDIDFSPTAPIEGESIEKLKVYDSNYEIYSKYSFNKVKELSLYDLPTEQIKYILTRFKIINKLEIQSRSLQRIDIRQIKVKQLSFFRISFKEPVYLPREIEKLRIRECEFQSQIKAQRVTTIDCSDNNNRDSKEIRELFKSFKGIKVSKSWGLLEQDLAYLPSTIRKIDIGFWEKIENLERITGHFPYLIEINKWFRIEALDKTKLRVITPKMTDTEEKFNLRPRKIKVNSDNAHQLNSHPELFEKVEWVYVCSDEFNFDVLPSEIKRIEIFLEVDEESITLNRLEKQRE